MASAHDPVPHYDRINLSAGAGREVPSDTSVAIMFKQHQSSDQSTATEEVNQAISWAVDKAKATDGVNVTTSSYRTQPIYNKQHIQGWRVLQTIRLESSDGSILARLLGTLQERVAIQSLNNTFSTRKLPLSMVGARPLSIVMACARIMTGAGRPPLVLMLRSTMR